MLSWRNISTLDLSVLYHNGTEVSDKINIIVTSIDIDVTIPTLSEALKSKYLIAINQARTSAQDCRSKGSFATTTKLTWSDQLYILLVTKFWETQVEFNVI